MFYVIRSGKKYRVTNKHSFIPCHCIENMLLWRVANGVQLSFILYIISMSYMDIIIQRGFFVKAVEHDEEIDRRFSRLSRSL